MGIFGTKLGFRKKKTDELNKDLEGIEWGSILYTKYVDEDGVIHIFRSDDSKEFMKMMAGKGNRIIFD